MFAPLTHYQRRTCRYGITVTNYDGSPLALAAEDEVRIKIGRGRGNEPLLDLVSGLGGAPEPTPGGSSIAFTPGTGNVVLIVGQGDVGDAWEPGVYEMEIAVVDGSETAPPDAIKTAAFGSFVLIGTMTGEIGDPQSMSGSSSSS